MTSHYFLAIPLPERIKAALSLLSEQLKKQCAYKVWTGPEDYHITLVFLGGVPVEQLQQLERMLEHYLPKLSSMTLALEGLSSFGSKVHPRVLFAKVQHSPLLMQNQQLIAECCKQCGLKTETRPYRPHVTLGKKWTGGRPISWGELPTLSSVIQHSEWQSEEIVLYEIHPGAHPKYKPYRIFNLKDRQE
ncbi:RNA 2',3'-cyclic phosphodiesterase [Pullulanibacillus camelliae]|uniref:RNA 2',3'-cyclic phosphodiesterase n=1 Tax=Pullulanibacillus camelliae TaxID=1707096 RepID=A0A8J3E0Q1_9BACL|nr:RNA 2',3'-cyclic phosphodiesterase [Pullulanibacillus camelliae]GGE55163.1 RNA 2',3'-cyclic phosphodiesterase [Pullulanibacillus camelliae]